MVVDLMLGEPDDRLRDATFELIDAITPAGSRIARSGHALCALFEQVALSLQKLIDAPGEAISALVGETVAGSRILASCATVLLKRAVQVATGTAMAPLTTLHLKACMCAVAFCPNSAAHPSLEKNCALPTFLGTIDAGTEESAESL